MSKSSSRSDADAKWPRITWIQAATASGRSSSVQTDSRLFSIATSPADTIGRSQPVNDLGQARAPEQRFVLDQPGDVGSCREMVDDAIEHLAAPGIVGGGRTDARDQVEEGLHAAGEHRFVERLLAVEMVVETGGREPDLARDVPNRGAGEPLAREEALRDVEDPLARRFDFGLTSRPARASG